VAGSAHGSTATARRQSTMRTNAAARLVLLNRADIDRIGTTGSGPTSAEPAEREIGKDGRQEFASSVRARQPAHGELDLVARKHAPAFDFGLVRSLGEAAQQLARLLAGSLAGERKGFAPENVAPLAAGDQLCCSSG
jgi:hypothetical protein